MYAPTVPPRGSTYAITSSRSDHAGLVAAADVGTRAVAPFVTSTVIKPGLSPIDVEKTRWRPSGDQLIVSMTSVVTIGRGVPPSALTIQMPRLPPRSDTNATCWPSGE